MEKPISFSVPGSLQILVERRKGVFEQFSNVDGLRIDKENKEIHYVFFDGKSWEKAIIFDAELTAARSIRDAACYSNSHTIEYFYPTVSDTLTLVGLKISSEDASGQYFETHYKVGQTEGSGLMSEKQYYNAGIKTLQDVLKICKDELKYKAEKYTAEISNILSELETINLFTGV